MNNLFSNCKNLINLDLSSFNTINVIDMSEMFKSCKKIINLDLSSFNTNNIIEMSYILMIVKI